MARQRDESSAFDGLGRREKAREKDTGGAIWLVALAAGVVMFLLACGGGAAAWVVLGRAKPVAESAVRPAVVPIQVAPPVVPPQARPPVPVVPPGKPPEVVPPEKEKPVAPEKQKPVTHKPVLTVKAGALSIAYGDSNSLVAASKYDGKCIEVTGEVCEVEKQANGTVRVAYDTLAEPGIRSSVYCFMRPGQEAHLGKIDADNVRNKTVIHGICRGKRKRAQFPGYAIDLDDCVLISTR